MHHQLDPEALDLVPWILDNKYKIIISGVRAKWFFFIPFAKYPKVNIKLTRF
jgi:hypothetical protein